MTIRQTSIRISDQVADTLTKDGATLSGGAIKAVEYYAHLVDNKVELEKVITNMEALQYIRAASRHELKGFFTPAEWMYLADALNGTIISPSLRCSNDVLVASILDADHFDGLGVKWDVDPNALADKIKKDIFPGAQVEYIYFHVENYWNKVSNSQDTDTWANEV